MAKDECPNAKNHTKQPTGYLAWHEWAEKKSKTHKQIKCQGCGRYEIWIKKSASKQTGDRRSADMNEDAKIEFKNDYDRIADELEEISLGLLASVRVGTVGDCTPVNDKQFLEALRQVKALHGWVEGLADTHRKAAIGKSQA